MFNSVSIFIIQLFIHVVVTLVSRLWPVTRVVTSTVAGPLRRFSLTCQVNILRSQIIAGIEPEINNGRITITVHSSAMRKLATARYSWIIIFTVFLSLARFFTTALFFSILLIMITLGTFPSFEDYGWEIEEKENELSIPSRYYPWFLAVFTISTWLYAAKGIGEFLACLYGLLWAVLYYQLLKFSASTGSKNNRVIIKCPPGTGIDRIKKGKLPTQVVKE